MHLLSILLLSQYLASAAEVALSEFPVYTQVTRAVVSCVQEWSSSLSVSYGCPANAGICLCTDALKSRRATLSIRSCAIGYGSTNAHTATELWRSYCSVNGGVSARDETIVEDIPIFTQVDANIASCVTDKTASFVVTFGCTEYTKAQCLCGAVENYDSVRTAINTCLYSTYYQASARSLWSSYCDVNLKTPAQRVVASPAMTIGDIDGTVPTTRTSSTGAAAGSPGSGAILTSTNSAGSNTSGESNTASTNSASPVGIAVGIVGGIVICAAVSYAILRYRLWRLSQTASASPMSGTKRPSHVVSSGSSVPLYSQPFEEIQMNETARDHRPKSYVPPWRNSVHPTAPSVVL